MKTSVIAEIGVNHNGKISLAKKIILSAKKIGVKIVKFQFYKTENLILPNTPMASYQLKNYFDKQAQDQFKMLKKFELSISDHVELSKFCQKKKIEYCCSFFNEDDLIHIKKLNLKRIKIPSGEINNFFLLKKIAKLNKKIILSTGMSSENQLKSAIKFLIKNGQNKKKITILHCCSSYPAARKDLNLNAISYLKKKYQMPVGLSDHSQDIHVPMIAVSKGAVLIEKHLTYSNKLNGPDHKASLNIINFKKMLNSIEFAEEVLGLKSKIITQSEKKNIFFVRKSIVAKKDILKGQKFSYENLTAKRPQSGKSLENLSKILGKRASKNYIKDELI